MKKYVECKMCKISIIIPVYNAERHINKCLESIFKQTFKDFEVLIVNDGSTDNSLSLIKQQINNQKNTTIINKKNEGLPQARKTGFHYASGEYVIFIDSDDWIEPNMLERLYKTIYEKNADIVCCGVVLETENGKFISAQNIDHIQKYDRIEAMQHLHQRTGIYPYMWNKIFRRNLIEENFFPSGHFVGEDYTTLIHILDQTHSIIQIPDTLYHYVQHKNNMTKAGYGKQYELAYVNYEKERLQLLENYPTIETAIINYHMLEQIAILNAMLRNQTYDNEKKEEILSYVQQHLFRYIFTSQDKIFYKVAAVIIAKAWSLYAKIYLRLC